MTRTEERLICALESAAAAVAPSRPLAAPEPARLARRRRVRLAAVAVATAAIAVIATLVAVSSVRPAPRPVMTAAFIGGSEPRVPAFFVDAGSTGLYDGHLRVVSLATGKVTATEPAPPGTADITFLAEQAQTGSFVAAFIGPGPARGLALYRFRVTGTGQITPLVRIGRILTGQQPEDVAALALSPDGSRLALSLTAGARPRIILLSLRTGARQVWTGGQPGHGAGTQVLLGAWNRSGLVFAARTCQPYPHLNDCSWAVRRLVTVHGGLRAGPALLRQPGTGTQILPLAISPDGASVVEVRSATAPYSLPTLVRVSLATGRSTVLHRWQAPGSYQVGPSEGNFLFVGRQVRRGNDWRIVGWVADGGFHALRYPARR